MIDPDIDLVTLPRRVLPHRGAALMIGSVLEVETGFLSCIAHFPRQNSLVRDGVAMCPLIVEPAAQAAATHLAVLATIEGAELRGLRGFLTSAKEVEIGPSSIPADIEFQIRVTPRGRPKLGPGLFKYRFEAERDGQMLARGELSTYVFPAGVVPDRMA